jgi:hypothetical protein
LRHSNAHVTEPAWLWERAKDWLTKDELEALKSTIRLDRESDQLIVNGKAGLGLDLCSASIGAGRR